MQNIDVKAVAAFGKQWTRFDQSALPAAELRELFERYFAIFPWGDLPDDAVGFDMGCGTGRWAKHVAPRVGQLHCIDASADAVQVARKNLAEQPNCQFHVASFDDMPLADASMDFGYCIGVLHYVPHALDGIRSCVAKLKPGAPLLLYVYYAFDNRPWWFRAIWRVSDVFRRCISKLPYQVRYWVTSGIALAVYFPLARLSRGLKKLGFKVGLVPLSQYRKSSFYTMRTDALDRFGSRLEHRYTAAELREMMEQAGLGRIEVSSSPPYWCAVGFKNP